MNFDLTEEQRLFGDNLDRFLRQNYNFQTRQDIASSPSGCRRDIWRSLAELGAAGMFFGEEAGGYGGTGFDIALVFEALGRALVIEPFLDLLMAGRALAAAGGHGETLSRMIAGDLIMGFAHCEPHGCHWSDRVETQAVELRGSWRLNGTKTLVRQLGAADMLLVSANAGDAGQLSLFLIPADAEGVSVRDYRLIDGGRAGNVTLNNVIASDIVGDAGKGRPLVEDAIAAGLVALCSEGLGIMEVLRDDTLEYLRTRQQFGTEIGRFQALQHRMATMLIEIEQMRSSVINACAALGGEPHARDRAASAAKFTIGRAGTLIAEEAIQLHGGIGMTWELPLPHYAKRLMMIGHQLGDEDHHLDRFIRLGDAVRWSRRDQAA